MTPIERQILRNQFHIMRYLWSTETSKIKMFEESIFKQIKRTEQLLNPIQEEEPCCEMPERIITEEEKEELYNNGKSLFANSGGDEE